MIDESKLLDNLEKISYLRKESGVKCLLALKSFAAHCVFDIMRKYMDGTTGSSPYEAKLGNEFFGGETHAYSVAYSEGDIKELAVLADKIIFNSINQLNRCSTNCGSVPLGIRINPEISHSCFDLADPARKFSRLGETNPKKLESVLNNISGVMLHFNCENNSTDSLEEMLKIIGNRYGKIFKKVQWVSLGGGIHFTGNHFNLNHLCQILKDFREAYSVQIYLEPGEAVVTQSTTLETTILDIVENKKNIAIVDCSVEAHMLDLIIYGEEARFNNKTGNNTYQIAGRSCLAGDIFGTARFNAPLQVGDRISIADAGGYMMVKKNWFNGLRMPSIVVKRLNGDIELIRKFSYNDYIKSLS